MTEHPAFLKFPRQEARIRRLMESEKEFAEICRDYADVVAEIGQQEQIFGHEIEVIADLIHLRSDLERDIQDRLDEPDTSTTAPD